MKLVGVSGNWGKWFPLIAIPVLIIAYYLMWLLNSYSPFGWWRETLYLALFAVHMVLFFALRSYKANIFFALAACLTWIVELYIFMPSFSRIVAFRSFSMELLLPPVICFLAINVIHRLFPNIYKKWFMQVFSILMAVFVVVFSIFDDPIFFTVFFGVLGLSLIYTIVSFILKLRQVRLEQITFLIGFAIFIYGILCHVLLYEIYELSISLPFAEFFLANTIQLFFLLTSAALLLATCDEVLESNADTQRLIAQEIIAESQLDFQREQFGRLMETVESTRFMRHDMKHHLAVINEYVQAENMSGIKGYLEGMEYGLNSSRSKHHCDNYAVNAIVSHYLSSAENDGAKVNVKLTVPADTGQVKESDLCVIVGNLLENAVDACRDVDRDKRFIRLFSYVSDNAITFTMENSFAGELNQWDGVFYSTKRDGEGLGLQSVAAVAEKYGGAANFETQDNVFISYAYVDMGDF